MRDRISLMLEALISSVGAHGAYPIFYRVEESRVAVIHVLHGARDYEALLFPED